MKFLLLMLLSLTANAGPNEPVTAKLATQITHDSFEDVDSAVYSKALKHIDREIIKASNVGDDVILLNMDDYVYGIMYDKIEADLKRRGFDAKWNSVGGIPGTSYTMYLQISWPRQLGN